MEISFIRSHELACTFELLGEESGVSRDKELELLVQVTRGQVHIPGANTYMKNRQTRETETSLLEHIKHAGVNYSCSEFTFPQRQQPSLAQTPNTERGVCPKRSRRAAATDVVRLMLKLKKRFGLGGTGVRFSATKRSFHFHPNLQCFDEEIPKILPAFIFRQAQGWNDYFSLIHTDISNFQQGFGSCVGTLWLP